MSTASESQSSSERTLSDGEFEDMLLRAWEIVRNQKQIHPLDPASPESPSWT